MAQRKPKRKAKNIQKIQLCKRDKEGLPIRDFEGNIIKINKFRFINHN